MFTIKESRQGFDVSLLMVKESNCGFNRIQVAITGNVILWNTHHKIEKGFRSTLVQKTSYVGLDAVAGAQYGFDFEKREVMPTSPCPPQI